VSLLEFFSVSFASSLFGACSEKLAKKHRGKKSLICYIENSNHWHWQKGFPVIHFSFQQFSGRSLIKFEESLVEIWVGKKNCGILLFVMQNSTVILFRKTCNRDRCKYFTPKVFSKKKN
jgi:hypothetical protein